MQEKRSKTIFIRTIPIEDIDSDGYVSQLNYLGNTELLKAKQYSYKLVCNCGKNRYYKPQDKKQVEKAGKCKPCLRKVRLKRRKNKVKKKAIKEVLEKLP